MATKTISAKIPHKMTADIKKALDANAKATKVWESLTPLTKNEWICWVTIVKKADTRKEHVTRMIEELNEGIRRPCCWPGCPHRNPNAKKWFGKLKK
jgi:uncharacterized protein YdeI (YjbR/CyaY-like superfamily)